MFSITVGYYKGGAKCLIIT